MLLCGESYLFSFLRRPYYNLITGTRHPVRYFHRGTHRLRQCGRRQAEPGNTQQIITVAQDAGIRTESDCAVSSTCAVYISVIIADPAFVSGKISTFQGTRTDGGLHARIAVIVTPVGKVSACRMCFRIDRCRRCGQVSSGIGGRCQGCVVPAPVIICLGTNFAATSRWVVTRRGISA